LASVLLPANQTTKIPGCAENHEMHVSVRWILVWILVEGGFVAAAVACAAAEPIPAVDRLLPRLSSGAAIVRDEAERALLDLGPAILPEVIAACAGATGETSFRLQVIRHRLEERAAAEQVDAAIDTLSFSVGAVEPVGGGRQLRIPLRVAWGPNLDLLAMQLPARTIMADGPAGEALPPIHRRAIVEPIIPPAATAVSLPLTLAQVAPAVESLATLRGTLTLWIAGRDHGFEVPLDGLPNSLRVGRATVALLDTTIGPDRLEVTARIRFDEPSLALASHRPWLTTRMIDVIEQNGQPLPRLDQRTAARSEQGLSAVASFRLPPGGSAARLRGLRLRWRLPVAIHEVPVDFVVREIPLPPPPE
jgi:hypothetical protein